MENLNGSCHHGRNIMGTTVSSQYVSNDRDDDWAGWLHDPPGTGGRLSRGNCGCHTRTGYQGLLWVAPLDGGGATIIIIIIISILLIILIILIIILIILIIFIIFFIGQLDIILIISMGGATGWRSH